MKTPFFPDLGVGVGLRPCHYPVFLNEKPRTVSWVEVISENYMDWQSRPAGRALQILEKIRQDYPVVLHGVSLSLGSADALDRAYLQALKKLIDAIQPAWISDHLCWTGVDGENLHDLLPLPYTVETLQLVTEKIKKVQDFLGRKILVENPSSYVDFHQSEMTEWEFIPTMLEEADCGILLDVNNVYVSSVNHRFDPMQYLRSIPSHRVGQIHLAGHTSLGGFLVDTHDEPVCEDVWSLYQWTAENFGLRSTMIERDDRIPAWSALEGELKRIHQIRAMRGEKMKDLGLAEFQRRFQQAVKIPSSPNRFGARGHFEVYVHAYQKRMLDSLTEDFPRVLEKLGARDFARLVEEYLLKNPSRSWTIAEVSRDFPAFLREDERWKSIAGLAEAADEDWLEGLALLAPEPSTKNQISPQELQNGLTPELQVRAHPSIFFASRPSGDVRLAWKKRGEVFLNTLPHAEAHLLENLKGGMPILELLQLLEKLEWDEAKVQEIFFKWADDGILLIEKRPIENVL